MVFLFFLFLSKFYRLLKCKNVHADPVAYREGISLEILSHGRILIADDRIRVMKFGYEFLNIYLFVKVEINYYSSKGGVAEIINFLPHKKPLITIAEYFKND